MRISIKVAHCTLVFKVKPWCMNELCNPPHRRSEEKDWWESWRNKTSRPITASNYDIGGSDLLANNEITEDIFRSRIRYDVWIYQYLRLDSIFNRFGFNQCGIVSREPIVCDYLISSFKLYKIYIFTITKFSKLIGKKKFKFLLEKWCIRFCHVTINI